MANPITGPTNKESYGSVYISTAAPTVITAIDTPIKVGGTYTAENLKNFDSPVNGQLRYTGKTPTVKTVSCPISLTNGVNDIVSFYLAKNGVIVIPTRQQRKISFGGDLGNLTILGSIIFNENDYIEVFTENNTAIASITAERLYLNVR